MDSTMILYIIIVALLFVIGNIIYALVTMSASSKMDKLRKSELEQQEKKARNPETDQKIRETIDKVTTPIVDNVVSKNPPKNLIKIQRKLYVAGWSKYFTPVQWVAFTIILKVVGVGLFFLLSTQHIVAGLIGFAVPGFMPGFLLNNSYNNRNENLLISFPETIRITSGYLSAGLTLPKACEKALFNVADEWKPLIRGFLVKCDTIGMLDALDWFKNEVDIVEAREFFATVRLTLELGGSARNGFIEQADNIQKLLRDAMIKRIEKRKIWATAVQAPIFLCIIGAFALPVIGSFIDLF